MQITEEPVGDVTHNCKNYATDGGNRLVIGGTLEIKEGASVTGLPAAAADNAGMVNLAANQAGSTAAEVAAMVIDFNALLQKLKDAGIMAADEPGES
jgi:hypothetical protein